MNPPSKKAVFLDRDGTLNKKINNLSSPKDVQILPGVITGIKKLNKNNIATIVITNQPVIARGLATVEDVKKINNALITILNKNGAYINAFYSCPHHPERNHSDIPTYAMKYRVECECRKPKIAMPKKATIDFNINLKSACFVGDMTTDIKTGENLGIPTILVKTGYAGNDNIYSVNPNFIVEDFSHATDIIINN